jgi:site-specific DNA-cytosine methylase
VPDRQYTDFHFFCGSGGGALGFQRAHARVGRTAGSFRNLGGIDSDPKCCRDYTDLIGTEATCLDLFDEEMYWDFHGNPPPSGWREATPADVQNAAGREAPDVVFMSPPCKGFSGLLNKRSAASDKYRALNELVVRSILLMLEAWKDDPPALLILENVPRIMTRGRNLLDLIVALLQHYGYAVAETSHDCGVIGGLSQHRKRFLMVARHQERVPPFLYEPPKHKVRGIGEVLDSLPLPEMIDDPMHRLPRLQWKTWVRLALVPAGGDWRDLEGMDWERYGIVPGTVNWHRDVLGVRPWDQPSGTVTGRSTPTDGRFSVADPRPPRDIGRYEPYGVVSWEEPSRTVTSQAAAGSGPYSVQDPRLNCDASNRRTRRYNNIYRVVHWEEPSGAVTAGAGPSSGGQAVADPRVSRHKAGSDNFRSSRHYGVLGWEDPSLAVVGHAKHDNGAHSVADPRLPEDLDRPDPAPLIISLDNTWHRPLTTMELAALQGFPVPLQLEGKSHSSWRERIGNAVPPPAAQAVAETMLRTLLLNDAGVTFELGNEPIWVQKIEIILALPL